MSQFIKFTNVLIKKEACIITRILPIQNLLYFDVNNEKNIINFYFKNNIELQTKTSNINHLVKKFENEIKQGKVVITINE